MPEKSYPKLTNKYNLPEEYVAAVAMIRRQYNAGESDYSVTTLLKPPRQVQLERRHVHELEEDAADLYWSIFGTVIHQMLESAVQDAGKLPEEELVRTVQNKDLVKALQNLDKGRLHEKRLYMRCKGKVISGQADKILLLPSEKALTDYKVTHTSAKKYRMEEWTMQLNIYKRLAGNNLDIVGYEPSRLYIFAMYKNWERSKASRSDWYPEQAVEIIPIPVLDPASVDKYIETRVEKHVKAELLPDKDLPHCTPQETWEREGAYVLKQATTKGEPSAKALPRLSFSEEEEEWVYGAAKAEAKSRGKTIFIEHRPAKRVHCLGYCKVASICSQFQEYLSYVGDFQDENQELRAKLVGQYTPEGIYTPYDNQ